MTERISASFRDPAGFVFRRDGILYRQINHRGRDDFDLLMDSGLYQSLVDGGLLVPHEVVEIDGADPVSCSLVIRPKRIPFISYPYEWAPGQLQAAGMLTLSIQKIALDHGMTLRDATGYNIQFVDGKPTLIDTLSFERFNAGSPWQAYGQYCRHFLAPLALIKHVDARLAQLLRTEIDGIPLDLASRLLPSRTRVQFGLGVHVHAHASSQRAEPHTSDNRSAGEATMSRRALLGLVDSLSAATLNQRWAPPKSAWRDYYTKGESYNDAANTDKAKVVSKMLDGLNAETIWDLGANAGQYSFLAAEVTDATVIAVESDPSAVEVMWRECQASGRGQVLPLLNDLANPSPDQGWANEERESLTARGPADVVLALALIHHLAIANNVPLPAVLKWLADLAGTVVIEWIPKEDPMVRRLLRSREDIFEDYGVEQFEDAIKSAGFQIMGCEQIAHSLRKIYLLERGRLV